MTFGVNMPGAYGVQPGLAPPPRKRRWGLLIGGILLSVLGVIAIVGGMIAMAVDNGLSRLDPVGEATMPDAISFVAEDETYQIKIAGRRGGGLAEDRARETNCLVTRADGSTATVDGTVQMVAINTGNVASVGEFRAAPGRTEVACSGTREGTRYIVDEKSDAQRIAIVISLAGAAVLLAGVALTLLGVFWKKPALTPAPRF